MKNIHLAEWLATVGKIGRIPGAPGTWGSLTAVLVWLILPAFIIVLPIFLIMIIIITVIGVRTSTIIEDHYQQNDPDYIVIDEWVGQWVALCALPQTWTAGLVAFVLFRIFDIAKPWPINKLQKLSKGWGVMADDLAAGLFAVGISHFIFFYWL